MGFYTEEIKENWEKFPGKRLEVMPDKYFDEYSRRETKYDHAMLYRDEKYDYYVVSPYPCKKYEEELVEEGFKPTEPMYSSSCHSYYKLFKNSRKRSLEPLTEIKGE